FVTDEDAAKHNDALDRYRQQYEEFLHTWPEVVREFVRIVTFAFTLENSGTAPADDVDVKLWTDASGEWLDKKPRLPYAPAVPRARNPFGIPSLNSLALQPYLADHLISRAPANEDGPNISGEGADQLVQYGVRRDAPVPVALRKVHFKFASDA